MLQCKTTKPHLYCCVTVNRCVLAMLRFTQSEGVLTRGDALQFIGQRFRIKMELPQWTSNEAVTMQLLKYASSRVYNTCCV